MNFINNYFSALWDLTIEMAPYLLLGFLIAGLLNGVFTKNWLQRKLGKPGFASSIKAALFGIPLPLCSCGVIPTGVSFHKNGASKGATTSFLISTPQTGVDSILITYALMGWAYAIIRPVIAFVTGVFGGFIADNYVLSEQINAPKCDDNSCSSCEVEDSASKKQTWFNRIFRYAFVTFLQDISRYLVLGLALAALITVAVPDSLFTEYVDQAWLNMLIVLIASVPLYVCATASVPIAAALLLKGISPGAAIVFLMAGPATNIATFTVLWNTIGKKTTLVYLSSIIGGALFFGFLIDYTLPETLYNYFLPITTITEQHQHILPHWLMIGSGIILIYLIIQAEVIRYIPQKQNSKTTDMTTYKIKGMTCNHCVANVEKNLGSLEQVTEVNVNLDKGTAQVEGQATEDQIKSTIESIGYQFEGKL
ncbi:SO_0444 family Cu/Zn efflux transporter [Psychroflexus sp. ALD_RP9]|uniref:SO_0444 family Cu/Zn efflux transporter n=1 Tax=Psychroflexus sp. ALD_RP9 TaxID=2777186 RepID=UPI001A8D9CE7|nr:SO_0444 family Cu/Zn efflux transporter [Psychroflexus sp. ALD_RP9]QSS97834.1 SO_0444 family Cu/Zn efflux transporter [Psychroflexus sp. ALD_RP9]